MVIRCLDGHYESGILGKHFSIRECSLSSESMECMYLIHLGRKNGFDVWRAVWRDELYSEFGRLFVELKAQDLFQCVFSLYLDKTLPDLRSCASPCMCKLIGRDVGFSLVRPHDSPSNATKVTKHHQMPARGRRLHHFCIVHRVNYRVLKSWF